MNTTLNVPRNQMILKLVNSKDRNDDCISLNESKLGLKQTINDSNKKDLSEIQNLSKSPKPTTNQTDNVEEKIVTLEPTVELKNKAEVNSLEDPASDSSKLKCDQTENLPDGWKTPEKCSKVSQAQKESNKRKDTHISRRSKDRTYRNSRRVDNGYRSPRGQPTRYNHYSKYHKDTRNRSRSKERKIVKEYPRPRDSRCLRTERYSKHDTRKQGDHKYKNEQVDKHTKYTDKNRSPKHSNKTRKHSPDTTRRESKYARNNDIRDHRTTTNANSSRKHDGALRNTSPHRSHMKARRNSLENDRKGSRYVSKYSSPTSNSRFSDRRRDVKRYTKEYEQQEDNSPANKHKQSDKYIRKYGNDTSTDKSRRREHGDYHQSRYTRNKY